MHVRSFLCAALLLGIAAAADKPVQTQPIQFPDGTTVPVVLKKTLDASKLRAGEEVRFELLYPVLAGGLVVIPENAKLIGHVVGATPLGTQNMSSLAVIIDRAEWKHHSVPLVAHLAGFGKMRRSIVAGTAKCNEDLTDGYNVGLPGRRGAPDGRVASGPSRPQSFDYRECDIIGPQVETDLKPLAHIKLRKTGWSDVPVLMVSAEKTIVLKKGLLLVLRSGGPPEMAGSVARQSKMPHP